MNTSIVIATRNRATQLEKSLESLSRLYAHRTDVEIVILDDGSTDQTPIILDRWFSHLGDNAVLQRTSRAGSYLKNPGGIFNRARGFASGDVLIEQGGEVYHLNDCVTPIYETCKHGGAMAIARVYDGPTASIDILSEDLKTKFPDHEELRPPTDGGTQNPPMISDEYRVRLFTGPERPMPFLFLGGMHKDDWERVDGYREDIAKNNDGDLAARLTDGKFRFVFLGNALAFHQEHPKE